jgi:dihydropteroate synthase
MSHRCGDSGSIAIMAPVSTVAQAVGCAAAGARLVDVGTAEALIPAIRRATQDLLICGYGEGADLVLDAGLAAWTGAGLICPDPAAAAAAVRSGITPDRVLVRSTPAQIERATEAGWSTLVDVDAVVGSLVTGGATGPLAGADATGSRVGEDGAGSPAGADAAGSPAGADAAGSPAGADAAGSLAGVEAVAAVCGWLGASVIRTRHVAEVRRTLDMTETIRGTRPPAWTVRGLA